MIISVVFTGSAAKRNECSFNKWAETCKTIDLIVFKTSSHVAGLKGQKTKKLNELM